MHTRHAHGHVGVLSNRHGAVFLLAIYFACLTLLALGGISLQRTVIEMRAAQTSRDLQQSFYLAEGGVDNALKQLRTDALTLVSSQNPDDWFVCGTVHNGAASCHVQTIASDLVETPNGPQLEMTRRIISRGQPAGSSLMSTVTATIRTRTTLKGMLADGTISIDPVPALVSFNRLSLKPITIEGDLRSAMGQAGTAHLYPGAMVDGDITIGPANGPSAYRELSGSSATAGVYIDPARSYDHGRLFQAAIFGTVLTQPMGNLLPITLSLRTSQEPVGGLPSGPGDRLPNDLQERSDRLMGPERGLPGGGGITNIGGGASASQVSCRSIRPLIVRNRERIDIRDGSALDVTPPGDGLVELCVSYLHVDEGGKVVIHDPTILFATGYEEPRLVRAIDNNGTINVIARLARRTDRGLTLVITAPPTGESRVGAAYLGDFEGSVYAPASFVYLGRNPGECDTPNPPKRKVGFIVAKTLTVAGVEIDAEHQTRHRASASNAKASPVSILGWTN